MTCREEAPTPETSAVQSISTVPLDSYPVGAAQNIIGLFARLGLEQFLLVTLFVVVPLRYRTMMPSCT